MGYYNGKTNVFVDENGETYQLSWDEFEGAEYEWKSYDTYAIGTLYEDDWVDDEKSVDEEDDKPNNPVPKIIKMEYTIAASDIRASEGLQEEMAERFEELFDVEIEKERWGRFGNNDVREVYGFVTERIY